MTTSDSRTPTAPARRPDGFPVGYGPYRSYLLFGASSVSMLIGCVVLIVGLHALGRGEEAWQGYLAALGSPPALLATGLVLTHTIYFAVRFGWMARKIAAGKAGGIRLAPRLPLWLLGVLPIAGFASAWLMALLLLGGAWA